ncbi:LuxR C-terminal-related transcriptional regulator [Roseovarius sp. EL26]|uniref:helix-turn-helix transcriptional regulator n=1 Tax=Roseovarius sp. EL26 TaxID=2126672 RepID=UPI000EA1F57E|nr:LuxR C-terminal-related transcriptional regulator [Roseovarius sp. EL26]
MSRSAVLWSLFTLQAFCCAYFLLDMTWDLLWPTGPNRIADSDTLEALVTVALFIGLIFTGSELRHLLTRQDQLDDQIKIASGAFNEVMEARFETWSLTAAEREVAILAIKGFSIAEIADLRETKQGTIKAQCASVYKKADVTGRLQLLSLFLDDLMSDDLIKTAQQAAK